MVIEHILKDESLDLAPYIAGHTGDRTVTYKVVDNEPIHLSFFYPPHFEPNRRYPAFLFVHGGGWRSRKIFADQAGWGGDHLGYLARYYADRSFVCVSIDYHLVDANAQTAGKQLSDLYEDCYDAVEYVLRHLAENGIDEKNIYLLGESAGGWLAGALATFHYRPTHQFKKVFLVNAITDLSNDLGWSAYVPQYPDNGALASLSIEKRAEFLSPDQQITASTCPVVLIHGANDRCVSFLHSERFHARMEQLGRPCHLHRLEDTDHAFLLAEYTDNLSACLLGIRILDKEIQYAFDEENAPIE